MPKILIEIDTETQRVVPIIVSKEQYDVFERIESGGYESYQSMLDDIFAAAPQPEPVDADLRLDAERYLFLRDKWWFCGVGDYLVRTALTAEELDSAIDSAMSQGEQK